MSRRNKPKKCIHCSRSDATEFHEIFDEVGIELQLNLLLKQYFKLQVTDIRNEQTLLCDECVNELIDLYDRGEKQKELENSAKLNEKDPKILPKITVAVKTENNSGNVADNGHITATDLEISENAVDEALIAVRIECDAVAEYGLTSILNDAEESVAYDEVSFDNEIETTTSDIDKQSISHVTIKVESDVDVELGIDDDVEVVKEESSNSNVETLSECDNEYDSIDAKTLGETFEIVDWKDSMAHEDDATMIETKDANIEEWIDVAENKNDDEIDDTVLQKYAEATINSNLEELQLERENVCNICFETLIHHQDLLLHIREHHRDEDGLLPCVLDNCQQLLENERVLARHIVLKHYDLRSITIFGACTDCGLTFSNFLIFNKHSCCQNLKFEKNINYCEKCKLLFPTFRRYRFHMQFHMKKSRLKVCLICDRIFKNGEEFFEHVSYEHEPPNEMMCTKCDRIYKNKKRFDSHMASHNLALKFECNLCPKAYSCNQWLKVHMQIHDEPMCEICDKTFTTKNSYRNHMKLHQSETDVQTCICFCSQCGQIGRKREDLQPHIENETSKCLNATIEEDLVNMVYFCEYCENVYRNKESLKLHRATGIHQDKIFRCHVCPATFDELRKVRSHFKSHKYFVDWRASLPLYRFYMCDVGDCEQSYAMWLSLHSHKMMKHKELRLICVACDAKFTNKEDFELHSSKCHKDGKFVCQFCGKQCATKMSRSVHIAKSHNNKNFSCSSCKASYKDEEALEKHVDLLHVAIKCSLCHKMMKNKRSLLLHQRVKHENTKRHFCETCNKGFYHKNNKEIHERMAHSATQYVCEKCPFTTNYQNSLDLHMARHNNDLKFECHICSRKFARKRVLELHVKRHEADREFVCSHYTDYECSASFVTRYLLNRHIRDKHSSDNGSVGEPQKKRSPKKMQRKVVKLETIDVSDPDDSTVRAGNKD